MTSIADVIDRLYRTYLEPPDEQPAEALLVSSLSPSATTVTFGTFQVPEDEQLIRQGTIIEIDNELMKIVSYNLNASEATVQRGFRTVAASHAADASIILAPPFPRLSVYEALSENISILGAQLYTVRTDYCSFTGGAAEVSNTAVSVVRIQPANESMATQRLSGEIVDYHPQIGGRAVVIQPTFFGSAYVTYRQRMTVPHSESDVLADLGIEDEWVLPIMLGTAADLLVGRDLSKSHANWVSQILESEAVSIGTRSQLAGALRGYRNAVILELSREMDQEYRPTVFMRDPFATITGTNR